MAEKTILPEYQAPMSRACTAALGAVGDALYAIGGKWKLRIIVALSEGPLRFNELQRLVEGISARVLSNELKELELNGFVKRNVNSKATPVIVEYTVTEYAGSLKAVVMALHAWGAEHRTRIRRQMKKDKELQ
ncbi:winged helix-turn-helix transcriptional regulator [Chitinophaga sp. Hz27]|uniref:winged helix-turn-helix transcriptional regulator n=1 Tax=Chitinophaga sp. Hz27 TaxID=3347169 RepID=UPI0035D548D3